MKESTEYANKLSLLEKASKEKNVPVKEEVVEKPLEPVHVISPKVSNIESTPVKQNVSTISPKDKDDMDWGDDSHVDNLLPD